MGKLPCSALVVKFTQSTDYADQLAQRGRSTVNADWAFKLNL